MWYTENEMISQKLGGKYDREQGGGNGNWLLTRKSDVLVDGKSYRTFVLEHYGKSKLTAKLVDKFREDVANGKIKL